MSEKLYLEDIVGCVGQWMVWDLEDIPQEVVKKLEELYDLVEKEMNKGRVK